MNVLVVVAHPDDEVLGAGGTIYSLTSQGHNVDVCILSSEVSARLFKPSDDKLLENINTSCKILGIRNKKLFAFPNIQFNTIPHIKLVQAIENTILEYKPDVIITHHHNDLNNDHYHTSIACQEAVRIFQRNDKIKHIKCLLFMEILSSTDWSFGDSSQKFNPNYFVEIKEEGVEIKSKALSAYKNVMRSYPHPRSIESIKSLAYYRGSQSCVFFAEAFEIGMMRRTYNDN